MAPGIMLLSVILIMSSSALGLWLVRKPSSAIRMQKDFYARINWKIEPISMAKEIRNTRIMGLLLAALALFTTGYLIVKNTKNLF
jgi:hypothetical protein